MKKLAIILAVALLASCAQSKDVVKQTEAPKSNQEKKVVEKTDQAKSTAVSSYSVFNRVKFDEFTQIFQGKYKEAYKTMSNEGEVPLTPLGDLQKNERFYDIRLSTYLVLSCVENDDGTLGMAVVMKMSPTQDPNYDADMVNKQFEILKQTLIAATAPGATADDLKAINGGLPKEAIAMEEQEPFVYKGIAYMDNVMTDDPAVVKESFMTTYE